MSRPVQPLAKDVLRTARRAGLDEQDPLWPVLKAMVALALNLGEQQALRPVTPMWERAWKRLSRRARLTLMVIGLAQLACLAFIAGSAHQRAVLRAATPEIAAAFATSGAVGSQTWATLMRLNDPQMAIARCEPLQGETGIPAWRWCRVTLRVPAP